MVDVPPPSSHVGTATCTEGGFMSALAVLGEDAGNLARAFTLKLVLSVSIAGIKGIVLDRPAHILVPIVIVADGTTGA